MTRRFARDGVISIVIAFLTLPLAAQTPAPKAAARTTRVYTPVRTAWGDPDLQGVYTNKDESGIPFERRSVTASASAWG